MQIKQDEIKLTKIYNEICDKISFFFKIGLQKIVIGCFYVRNLSVPSMQIWVHPQNEKDFKTFNSHFKGFELISIELQDKCEELHEFFKKYGDDWRSFTFIFREDRHFTAYYDYEPIKTIDKQFLLVWKGNYFYE